MCGLCQEGVAGPELPPVPVLGAAAVGGVGGGGVSLRVGAQRLLWEEALKLNPGGGGGYRFIEALILGGVPFAGILGQGSRVKGTEIYNEVTRGISILYHLHNVLNEITTLNA